VRERTTERRPSPERHNRPGWSDGADRKPMRRTADREVAHGRGEPLARQTQESQGRRRAEKIQRERPQPAVGFPLNEAAPAAEHRRPRSCLINGPAWPIQGGSGSREVTATTVRSCSEGYEPRERAWLKGHQGGRRGSKAPRRMVSVRAQHDPVRQTSGSGGSRRLGCAEGAKNL